MKSLDYISQRKQEILKMIETDHKIDADPYDNVARLKEIEKIQKILKRKSRKDTKMYSPTLNPEFVRVLYRLKRAYKKPMTEVAEELIAQALKTADKEFVCKVCISEKNNECKECHLSYSENGKNKTVSSVKNP